MLNIDFGRGLPPGIQLRFSPGAFNNTTTEADVTIVEDGGLSGGNGPLWLVKLNPITGVGCGDLTALVGLPSASRSQKPA